MGLICEMYLYTAKKNSKNQAFAFYSRCHIKTGKLKELKNSYEATNENFQACKVGFNGQDCSYSEQETEESLNELMKILVQEKDTLYN